MRQPVDQLKCLGLPCTAAVFPLKFHQGFFELAVGELIRKLIKHPCRGLVAGRHFVQLQFEEVAVILRVEIERGRFDIVTDGIEGNQVFRSEDTAAPQKCARSALECGDTVSALGSAKHVNSTQQQPCVCESGNGVAALQSGCAAAHLREALWSAETPSPLLHPQSTSTLRSSNHACAKAVTVFPHSRAAAPQKCARSAAEMCAKRRRNVREAPFIKNRRAHSRGLF